MLLVLANLSRNQGLMCPESWKGGGRQTLSSEGAKDHVTPVVIPMFKKIIQVKCLMGDKEVAALSAVISQELTTGSFAVDTYY